VAQGHAGSFCWRTVSNTRKELEGRLASFVNEDEALFVLSYSPTGVWLSAKDGPATKPKRIIDRKEFIVTVTPTFRVVGAKLNTTYLLGNIVAAFQEGPRPPYWPDIAPGVFHLLGMLKRDFEGRTILDGDELMNDDGQQE
jgi:hypothetical protein